MTITRKFGILVILISILLSSCGSAVVATEPPSVPSDTATLPPIPTATATLGEHVNVSALCTLFGRPAESHIASGSPVYVNWNWTATTSDLVQLFIEKTTLVVTFNGQPLNNPSMSSIDKDPNSVYYIVKWRQDVGVLEPGTYAITYDASWDEQISDGVDTYGPNGKYPSLHDACTLIVDP